MGKILPSTTPVNINQRVKKVGAVLPIDKVILVTCQLGGCDTRL